MHRFLQVLGLSALLTIVAACSTHTAQLVTEDISIAKAKSFVSDKKAIILDVRTPEEYAAGHIPGAVNININNDEFAKKVALLDRSKTYVVHCAANVPNGRTDKSFKVMNKLGFSKLLNLEGGIIAWQQEGQQVVKGED
mgnify:CR=1 FL=1